MSLRNKQKQARRNGAKAAGTKSPAGLQASSQNATKHGLTGRAIVLSNESQTLFDDLHLTYVREFAPKNGVEMDLIDQMVAAQWRLRRIWRMQTAALDLKMDQQEAEIARSFKQIDQATRTTVAFTALANADHTLELLLRYETAYTRMQQRAVNTLLKLRKEKLRNDPEPPATPAPADLEPVTQSSSTMLEKSTKPAPTAQHDKKQTESATKEAENNPPQP